MSSNRGWRLTQHFQIVGPATGHPLPADRPVEADETSFERHREAEKINVSQDLRSRGGKIEAVFFEDADRVGPETMPFHAGQFCQYVSDPRHRQPRIWISRLAQDTETPVFCNGARRPSESLIMLEPEMRERVKFMCRIDERDQDIDVEQTGLPAN